MIRVAELAKGVVEEFRESRKDKLKRTFVTASDAASSKISGQKRKGGGEQEAKEDSPSKKVKTDTVDLTEEKSNISDSSASSKAYVNPFYSPSSR